ncbi:serine endopeptidase [Cupriavidus necator]
MFKQLRGPERLFRLGQWIVALLFAYCLSQVGASLIQDLPLLSRAPQPEEFVDRPAVAALQQAMAPTKAALGRLNGEVERASSALQKAQSDYGKAKASFDNWRSARSATEQSEQNSQVLARTRELDRQLKAQQALEQQLDNLHGRQRSLAAQMEPKEQALVNLESQAGERYTTALRHDALKVFAMRLTLVAPILLAALWVFRRYRKSRQWPFAWGFILFALFAFFVELVPYLPSFGGYIRYSVGAVLTYFGGRALMRALQAYLDRKQQEQAAPQASRKQDIRYEKALDAMARSQCPSCDRSVASLEGAQADYCMHCGLGLYSACAHCGLRRSTFFHFCPSCGAHAQSPSRSPGSSDEALHA